MTHTRTRALEGLSLPCGQQCAGAFSEDRTGHTFTKNTETQKHAIRTEQWNNSPLDTTFPRQNRNSNLGPLSNKEITLPLSQAAVYILLHK